MRYLLTFCLLLMSAPSWAMEHYINNLQDRSGNAIGGVMVTVYQTGTLTKATIFSDNGSTIKSNPFLSDANGYYDFYATNGIYDFTFSRAGFTFPMSYRRISLFDVNDGGGGSGSAAFSAILSGTNTGASMVVGTGAVLTASGTGVINATVFQGFSTIPASLGGTGTTTPSEDNILVGNGTSWELKGLPSCSNATSSKLLYDNSTNTFSCGTDQGASSAFDAITSGTNISAVMAVGSGASLTYSGTGTLNASSYRGNITIAVADGGTNLTSATEDGVMVGNGTTWQIKTLPDCSNPITSKLLYDFSANAFSCGTDQSSGGGTTFNSIGSGTNTTAAMVVGSGASLAPTGTGTITATAEWPGLVTVNAGNSPYTVGSTDNIVLCDTTAAARTVNLPAASNRVRVTVYNLGSNTCTINRAGADTITTGVQSGLTSFAIRNAGSNFWLKSNESSIWYVGG